VISLVDHATAQLSGLLGGPWVWLVVFLVAGLDAVLPFMPSEGTVIVVAVLVAANPAQLALLVGVAAAGALAGDCLGYAIGRWAGPRLVSRLRRGDRGRRMHDWAADALRLRGAVVIFAGRYVPGGRVATMLTAGALGYPPRRFLVMDSVATTVWAGYATAIGFAGGAAFTTNPAAALLLALGIGLLTIAVIEIGRRLAGVR
jgi:membrane protein DedA with SNARE-associated domain